MRRRGDRRPGGRPSQVLVAGAGHLQLAGQAHPQLQGVRTFVTEGQLAMDDSAPGGHPLDVAGVQCAGVAKVVAVLEHAVEDRVTVSRPLCGCHSNPGVENQSSLSTRNRRSSRRWWSCSSTCSPRRAGGLAEDGLIDTLIGGAIVLPIGFAPWPMSWYAHLPQRFAEAARGVSAYLLEALQTSAAPDRAGGADCDQ